MMGIILVAGGAGFIGSNLCEVLLKRNKRVLCVDNMSTGEKTNLESPLHKKNFQFIQGDIRDSNFVKSLHSREINEIYDLASPASVTYLTEHPVDAATANSIGLLNLLKLAHTKKAKLLFASSSECYGDPKEHPQKETYWGNVNCVGLRSGYDEGKRFGEALCMAFHRELNVDIKIVRIFNTYGKNTSVQDTRVIPRFAMQALLNKPLTIHGDGKQTRSFCYVSDLVDGIVRMIESNTTGPINLGNPDEYRVIDMAKKVIAMTGSSSKISFVKRPEDDPSKRKPDIGMARKILGWEPKVYLEEGLKKTIEYFRKMLGKNNR